MTRSVTAEVPASIRDAPAMTPARQAVSAVAGLCKPIRALIHLDQCT